MLRNLCKKVLQSAVLNRQFSTTASTVASTSTSSELRTIAAVVNGGSRFETPFLAGSGQFVSHLSHLGNVVKGSRLSSTLKELGGFGVTSLEVIRTRDHLIYAANTLKENEESVSKTLSSLATDLSTITKDNFDTAREHLLSVTSEQESGECDNKWFKETLTKLWDGFHDQAFRGQSLSRPLSVSRGVLSHLNAETISRFLEQTVKNSSPTVLNIPSITGSQDSSSSAKSPQKPQKQQSETQSFQDKYIGGGEFRLAGRGDETTVLVGFQGFGSSSSDSLKSSLALRIFAQHLGLLRRPHHKSRFCFGSNPNEKKSYSQLRPGVDQITSVLSTELNGSDSIVEARAASISYSDTGLLIVAARTHNKEDNSSDQQLNSLPQKLVDLVRKSVSSFNEDNFKAAKNQFLVNYYDNQVTLHGKVKAALEGANIQIINDLTFNDVKKAAEFATKSKPTVAVAGNIEKVEKAL